MGFGATAGFGAAGRGVVEAAPGVAVLGAVLGAAAGAFHVIVLPSHVPVVLAHPLPGLVAVPRERRQVDAHLECVRIAPTALDLLTRPAERNRLSAWAVVVNMAGQVGILVLGFLLWPADVSDAAFALAGALMALGVLVTVVWVREPPPAAWAAERRVEPTDAERPPIRLILARYRGAAIFCLVAFAYWSGVNAVMPLVSV